MLGGSTDVFSMFTLYACDLSLASKVRLSAGTVLGKLSAGIKKKMYMSMYFGFERYHTFSNPFSNALVLITTPLNTF